MIYGLTSEYGSTTLRNNTYALTHEFTLSGLVPDTTYHFSAISRDAAGNLTLSVDSTFRTLPESDVGTEPPEGGSTGEPDGSESGDSSAGTGSVPGSGPHGGGSIDITPPGQPERVRASGLDRTVLLSWDHPADRDFSHVRVVRSVANYPANPTDGALVYEGTGRIFSDTGLENGKTYYYSLFAADGIPNYAPPVQLSIAPQAGVTQYHVATAENDTIRMLTTDTYGQGREGQEVAYLQRLLATNPQLYPEGLVTGYFGPLTEAALKRFQEKYDIPQTGMVDGDTRAIARTLSVPRVEESPVSALDMQLGDSGDNVRVLQTALVRLGYLAAEAITGYFGELTRAAVISFQRDRGIEPAAGYVGPKTRAAGVLELSGN